MFKTSKRIAAATAITATLLVTQFAQAGTVLSTDFASLSNGTVVNADLNGVTTGGTWVLNQARVANFEIQDSGGDKALLLDDPDSTGNSGTVQFAAVLLSSAVNLSTDSVTWDFRTAARRTGTDKGLRYQFFSANGNDVAATLDWYNSGFVSLNFGEDTVNTANTAFTFLNPWDPNAASVRDVSVQFDGTAVNVSFGGESLAGTVQNGVTGIGRVRIYSIAAASSARGLFLDDVTVTTAPVPEPGSIALLGLGSLLAFTRRRRA